MRLLVDSCVWGPVVGELRAAGHDVSSVREWGADPGDDLVLKRSNEEDRILVTLDKDFGEIVFVGGLEHRGILRLMDVRAREQGAVILRVLKNYGTELEDGAMIVATPTRVRVRESDKDT